MVNMWTTTSTNPIAMSNSGRVYHPRSYGTINDLEDIYNPNYQDGNDDNTLAILLQGGAPPSYKLVYKPY